MAQNDGRTNTSTQIRNFYSEGMSYMNVKFYNTNLSFQLYPFTSRDNNGRSQYDMKAGQVTTVNFENAFALYSTMKDIIDGKIQECTLNIPCAAGAMLILERKMTGNGYETYLNINKNNINIPFRFPTNTIQVKENGNYTTKTIESGLGALLKTVEGYLTGINADRHLDKLTDDFAKLQNENGNNNNNQNQNWNKNRNYNNNNRGYSNNYSNNKGNRNYNNNWNNNQQPKQQQDFSTYQIRN